MSWGRRTLLFAVLFGALVGSTPAAKAGPGHGDVFTTVAADTPIAGAFVDAPFAVVGKAMFIPGRNQHDVVHFAAYVVNDKDGKPLGVRVMVTILRPADFSSVNSITPVDWVTVATEDHLFDIWHLRVHKQGADSELYFMGTLPKLGLIEFRFFAGPPKPLVHTSPSRPETSDPRTYYAVSFDQGHFDDRKGTSEFRFNWHPIHQAYWRAAWGAGATGTWTSPAARPPV